jgi:glutaminase
MIKYKEYLKLLSLLVIINFGLSGCFNSKINECRKITDISTQLAEITQTNLATEDTNKIVEIADNFDNSAQQILDKKITDSQLTEYNKKLAIIYQSYGQFTRNFIIAFQNKDTENAIFYKQKVTDLAQEQEDLVNNINSYCQSN